MVSRRAIDEVCDGDGGARTASAPLDLASALRFLRSFSYLSVSARSRSLHAARSDCSVATSPCSASVFARST